MWSEIILKIEVEIMWQFIWNPLKGKNINFHDQFCDDFKLLYNYSVVLPAEIFF